MPKFLKQFLDRIAPRSGKEAKDCEPFLTPPPARSRQATEFKAAEDRVASSASVAAPPAATYSRPDKGGLQLNEMSSCDLIPPKRTAPVEKFVDLPPPGSRAEGGKPPTDVSLVPPQRPVKPKDTHSSFRGGRLRFQVTWTQTAAISDGSLIPPHDADRLDDKSKAPVLRLRNR